MAITKKATSVLREDKIQRWVLWTAVLMAGTIVTCKSLALFAESDGDKPSSAETIDRGSKVYRNRCLSCHEVGAGRIPSRRQLGTLPRDLIVKTLSSGIMVAEAEGLSAPERNDVATFLTAKQGNEAGMASVDVPPAYTSAGNCGFGSIANDWNGWGRDFENSRYQPRPQLTAAEVPALQLKWAFGLPGRVVRGQPTVVGGRVYVASSEGHVYSLDAKSGQICWVYQSGGSVRSAISVGPRPGGGPNAYAAYFGDDTAFVHAVDALTGQPLWKVKVDSFEGALITGSPVLYAGRLYVPVSSNEEMRAGFIPDYECCRFRGSIVALDATDGHELWKTYAISHEPAFVGKASDGRNQYGPAGAAVWGAPTIDGKRNTLYFGTGNSYTATASNTTDAILALDLQSGAIKWSQQFTARDNYLMNCNTPGRVNCPQQVGNDFDFGASPILDTLVNGKQIVVAGQKSGVLYALDPDNHGAVLWRSALSSGGYLGGIEWGPGADTDQIYVAISDLATKERPDPGLYAVNASNGTIKWHAPAPSPPCSWKTLGCSHAQSAAVTVIPGIVFSGSLDGHLRAYASDSGKIVWDVDTASPSYETVNKVTARGGSLDTGGPAVVGGVVYVNSGYAQLAGRAGNVLLAYSVPTH